MAELFQSWDNPVNPIRNDLVFANRNKAYGAYDIRQRYNKRVVMALLFALATIVLAVGIPLIVRLLSDIEHPLAPSRASIHSIQNPALCFIVLSSFNCLWIILSLLSATDERYYNNMCKTAKIFSFL